MSDQECALYGELVRYVRDRCSDRLAQLETSDCADTAKAWVDGVIREWFFAKQEDLHGSTPRDVIWRERKGLANVVDDEHKHELFSDDCPLCREMKEIGGEWHWHYDDGGHPLIAEYDPKGWDEYWKEDEEKLARRKDQSPEQEEDWDEENELRRLFEEEDEDKS